MNLLQAINTNNVERVKELLANSQTNVNVTDNHNFTGELRRFSSKFMQFKESISLAALHHAVIKKNLEICKLLIEHNQIDLTVRSYEGCTAMMIGIVANVALEIIELLVEAQPSLVTIKNNEEVPPLHEAVKNRRLDIVKLLLENGASVNDFDLDLENALHLAASNSDYDTIEYLLNETEVDTRAKNRDEMNPLCLLLVRSRNEDQDLVARCFFLMLENTYDKEFPSNTYTISDIFQCAFLACVYSHTEVVKFLIHNVYSVNNSKYTFIRKLSEFCDGDNTEFLYYILVFLHDEIDRYDKFSFPRFYEINYYMCIRSVIHIIEVLLQADDAVQLIETILDHMKLIGFNVRVKEFEDQIGVLLHTKYSKDAIPAEDLRKIDKIFEYLMSKGFRLNLMVRSYLQSIAISKEFVHIESTKRLLRVLLHFATTFFVDLENWRQINDFKALNPQIQQIIEWLVRSFGNLTIAKYLDLNLVYSLKQISRHKIRMQVQHDTKILCNHQSLLTLGLPDVLLNYIVYKD